MMRLYLEGEAERGGQGFMTSPGPGPLADRDSAPRMLFKGNSSRLELLIEKIQANKENHHVSEQDIKGTPVYGRGVLGAGGRQPLALGQ